MQCLNCYCLDFTVKSRDFPVYLNAHYVNILAECYECNQCKSTLMDSDQMGEMLRKYRSILKEIAQV